MSAHAAANGSSVASGCASERRGLFTPPNSSLDAMLPSISVLASDDGKNDDSMHLPTTPSWNFDAISCTPSSSQDSSAQNGFGSSQVCETPSDRLSMTPAPSDLSLLVSSFTPSTDVFDVNEDFPHTSVTIPSDGLAFYEPVLPSMLSSNAQEASPFSLSPTFNYLDVDIPLETLPSDVSASWPLTSTYDSFVPCK